MVTTTTAGRHASPLLAIRQRRRLTQERLAALSGVSRGWLGYLERNPEAMSPRTANALARILGVKPKELRP